VNLSWNVQQFLRPIKRCFVGSKGYFLILKYRNGLARIQRSKQHEKAQFFHDGKIKSAFACVEQTKALMN
jgi:hypothetical protein